MLALILLILFVLFIIGAFTIKGLLWLFLILAVASLVCAGLNYRR